MEWAPEETLTSAQRKLKRGIEHVETLSGEASAFEDDDAYLFEAERNARSAQEIEYRCFAVQRKPMPLHWPLLAGEAVQNLRSALDHLVYEISGKNRRTQFPIFTDPCEFQVLGSRKLKGVSAEKRALIEGVQPYRLTPDAPAQDFLARLSSLSNLDKHRVLATVVAAVHQEAVGIPDGVKLTWEDYATNEGLGAGKAHISTFVARTEGEADDVDVEPIFRYQVRIEGRPINDFRGLGNHVYRVFAEVDTGQPLSPFAPYPL